MKKAILLIITLLLSMMLLSSCVLNNIGNAIDMLTDPTPGYFTYNDFTDEEKNIFITNVGLVIPFAPTDEYYVTGFYEDGDYNDGIRFYTFDNTKEDFESYRNLFSSYEFLGTEKDEAGDLWYSYQKDNVIVSMSYYRYIWNDVIDVFVYTDGSVMTDSGVITNAGCGLPEGINGVHRIDFTSAKYVKSVTDQGNYEGGCPTVGSPAVLVIPVEFSDATAAKKGYSIEKIKRAFNGKSGSTDYYSVDEYYYISSYGKLDLDITVLDEWFCPENTSSYYKNQKTDYYGDTIEIGDQMILNEALDYLDDKMDLSKFDSDGNGIIDAVVMINTLKVGDENFNWAYRYWNVYTDENDEFYEYDGVIANDYLWMAYGFMHEKTGFLGNSTYTDTSVMNTHTYIHEFGHILGADDYYNTASFGSDPMKGYDIMDSMLGDHNAFTKFNFGWITDSRLVTAKTSLTLKLKPFTESGDTIIIANNWDDDLGAYQEYYVLAYYTNTGLNSGDGGYFDNSGIVVYHINASLCYEEYGKDVYYDVNNNNTWKNDKYGTVDNLIEFVKLINEGGTLPTLSDDNGDVLCYTFKVDSLTDTAATITFNVK